ncbi:hypothetical protein AXG93_4605s1140 [Marchantia polymorpha subsp. ruderalis]|uniref:Uncharacterized protein n=1 Tax=Marchantia polymorpha subsp. ruderalis TaxID=1480154 RepID=A0A176WM69_MARPO|nr:hypothetical protein AXG93_4605s1140 [Marchantia polymorpha subsp. ruderalis]
MQESVDVATKDEKKVITPVEEKKFEGENHVDVVVIEYGEKKEKKKENNEITLNEHDKILEEKRKAFAASKAKERKVEADNAFEIMQMVDKKSTKEDVFIRFGTNYIGCDGMMHYLANVEDMRLTMKRHSI